jgi:hypothetical protein
MGLHSLLILQSETVQPSMSHQVHFADCFSFYGAVEVQGQCSSFSLTDEFLRDRTLMQVQILLQSYIFGERYVRFMVILYFYIKFIKKKKN